MYDVQTLQTIQHHLPPALPIWSRPCLSAKHVYLEKRKRDEFGNLRIDETDPDVTKSAHFSAVLEAVDYDDNSGSDGEHTLGGVYGAAGTGGRVVTASLDIVQEVDESEVFLATYVPFVAGTHSLNVTYQVLTFLVGQNIVRLAYGWLIRRIGLSSFLITAS